MTNARTYGARQGFTDAAGVETRCPACNRLLFVSRVAWCVTALACAEIVLVCPARRGGWACKRVVALARTAGKVDG